jgi:hypothetical protein
MHIVLANENVTEGNNCYEDYFFRGPASNGEHTSQAARSPNFLKYYSVPLWFFINVGKRSISK